jgi:YVTN family beta-propeller protein
MRAVMFAIVLALGLALASPARPSAQASGAGDATLWVTFGDSDQLVEVDPYTFAVGRRIQTDPHPHGLSASPDGRTLYVASDRTGNFQAIDAGRGTVIGQVHVGNDPNQMALTKDGRFAFVPLRGDNQIAVVRLQPTLAVVKMLPAPARPHDAYTSADGSRIFIGSLEGHAITEIDPAEQRVVRNIPMPDGVRPLEIARDGKTIYAALSNLIGFVVVDVESGRVTRRMELAKKDPGVPQPYLDTYTHALQLSPDERELWVTDCVNDLVRVVTLADMQEVARIQVGHFPHWFALRPDGKTLFVSDWYSDAVTALDLAARKVVGNVQFERQSGVKRILVTARPTSVSAAAPRSNFGSKDE